MSRRMPAWVFAALVWSAACNAKPAAPSDTGSRQATRAFFEAVIHGDWSHAYGLLDADSHRGCGEEQFGTQAKAYVQRLGFEAKAVHVQSCEERGASAIAHLVLTGSDGKKQVRFREGAELRKNGDAWTVVLPAAFGRRKGR